MERILLDTSALFASLDADDPNHELAQLYLDTNRVVYLLPETVFSEAMTLIKNRLGVALAVRVGQLIRVGTPFVIHRLTPQEVEETWRIFSRYQDKEWSYTDCSLLAVSHGLGIYQVFAFDHHFDHMAGLGLQRVP